MVEVFVGKVLSAVVMTVTNLILFLFWATFGLENALSLQLFIFGYFSAFFEAYRAFFFWRILVSQIFILLYFRPKQLQKFGFY